MDEALLLPGIQQHKIRTDRLRSAYLRAGQGAMPLVLLHGNTSSSLFYQDFMLALARSGLYAIYAPDMRGFGKSEGRAVDATHGARDFSADLAAFVQALKLPRFHAMGWSLGGNVVIQYALDYPGWLRSLTLEAPASPFGLGGTKDVEGTPTWPDFAGSGGGTAAPTELVKRMAAGDRGSERYSPRTILNNLYFKPSFRLSLEREEILLSAFLMTKVGPENFPGEIMPSRNWPLVAPGLTGINNAFSPKYLNQWGLVELPEKPPVLWVHGTDDLIVSDSAMTDFGGLGERGLAPGWPGVEIYPPQPMKKQIRSMLRAYQQNGGEVQEVEFPDCGHIPHIEKQEEMLRVLTAFIEAH
ncbi:alpha/beta hydrolase [Ktedonosporobacter rubrisoli]|uniref:Alpha/beta hydrolase n=1 Tax=Ktedonosporobacter rubrisoli TaxID=2509675 RepID=A0A4P6K0B5_KTERU|nr:alpha/beta hydrolase [Ktedonosporobacter rubrisoli]QBD80836.1 alpha/beta hydrolase [Ktedonosporobacter rubrisoli]